MAFRKPCTICVQSCPLEAVEIRDSGDCIRTNPESFRVTKNKGKCKECEECFSLRNCPLNEVVSTDIFGSGLGVEQGCSTCFVCRGTPACIKMEFYRRGLKQFVVSFFWCFYLVLRRIL
ncbi:hypothetical protein B6V00_04990 [ANME-1 cluster archaeon ex4572_4]|nr:MAG: hypothetical protein B6V00_04990 [ANME-1 cluster archaeon ex4572_4]PXF51654.1 MAG: hypothetical protein C4B55_04625 [Methanophagales archaeon]